MEEKKYDCSHSSDVAKEKTFPATGADQNQDRELTQERERIMQEVLRLMKKEPLRTVSPSKIAVRAKVSREVYQELFEEKPENVLCAIISDHKHEAGLDWKGLMDESISWMKTHPDQIKAYYRDGLAGNMEMLIYSLLLCFFRDMETQTDIDREWVAHLMSGTVNGIIECYESAQTQSDKERLDQLTRNLVDRVRDFAAYKGLIGSDEAGQKKALPGGKEEKQDG